MKRSILDHTFEELTKVITGMGEPAYRAKQIFSRLYRKGTTDLAEIKEIPGNLRKELEKKFCVVPLSFAGHLRSRKDATEKFVWELADKNLVETVLIKSEKRKTLCLSTQVGCRFRCPFCASGRKGFVRDLAASEMVAQLLEVQRMERCRVTNIVFMGMGEPLDNFDNMEKAIRIMNHPDGISIGARKMTISTCGIIPGIKRLKDLGLQVELSISLHGTNDEIRNELVPVNRKYPIKDLIEACKEYSRSTNRMITLEYTLIKGKNDLARDAAALGNIAKELGAKVNLIACNAASGGDLVRPDRKELIDFKKKVEEKGVKVTVRESRGEDILAACGQLAGEIGEKDQR